MEFQFISPYDGRRSGLRRIGAVLQAEGHEAHWLHIAGFVCPFVPGADAAQEGRLGQSPDAIRVRDKIRYRLERWRAGRGGNA